MNVEAIKTPLPCLMLEPCLMLKQLGPQPAQAQEHVRTAGRTSDNDRMTTRHASHMLVTGIGASVFNIAKPHRPFGEGLSLLPVQSGHGAHCTPWRTFERPTLALRNVR